MIRCPYCGRDLPNKLPNCPACRNPIPGGSIPSIRFEGDMPLPRNDSVKQEYDLDNGVSQTVHDLDTPTPDRDPSILRRKLVDVTIKLPGWEPTGAHGQAQDPPRLTKTQIGDVLVGFFATLLVARFWMWGFLPAVVFVTVVLVLVRRYRDITWGAVGALFFIVAYLAIGLFLSGAAGGSDQ